MVTLIKFKNDKMILNGIRNETLIFKAKRYENRNRNSEESWIMAAQCFDAKIVILIQLVGNYISTKHPGNVAI